MSRSMLTTLLVAGLGASASCTSEPTCEARAGTLVLEHASITTEDLHQADCYVESLNERSGYVTVRLGCGEDGPAVFVEFGLLAETLVPLEPQVAMPLVVDYSRATATSVGSLTLQTRAADRGVSYVWWSQLPELPAPLFEDWPSLSVGKGDWLCASSHSCGDYDHYALTLSAGGVEIETPSMADIDGRRIWITEARELTAEWSGKVTCEWAVPGFMMAAAWPR